MKTLESTNSCTNLEGNETTCRAFVDTDEHFHYGNPKGIDKNYSLCEQLGHHRLYHAVYIPTDTVVLSHHDMRVTGTTQ